MSQTQTTQNTKSETEVLFQKLGNKWYVFSEINDDFVYSALPDGINPHTTKLELFEIIEEHMHRISKHCSRETQEIAS